MRAFAYMKYMSLGVVIIATTAAGVRSQERQVAQPQGGQQGNESCADMFNAAALQKEIMQMRSRVSESLQDVQARTQQYETEVAREMSENRMKSEEFASLAARSASQQAQQLFAQGLLQNDEGTGYLGLEMTEVSADKAKELKLTPARGVLVAEVATDGPAAKAGLQASDVILAYDGHDVEGTVQFRRLVRETPPGRSVTLTVLRDGHEQKLTIQVGSGRDVDVTALLRNVEPLRTYNFKMEAPEIFIGSTPTLGIEAEDVSGQLGAYFGVPGEEGVLVREVSSGTPAAKAGVKAGDVITSVNGAVVRTVNELRQRLREDREEKTVALKLMRQGSATTITVTIEPPETQHEHTRSAAL